MSSERYASRRAMQRTLRPATRRRLQHLAEDAAQLAPAILKDVVVHNLSKPFRKFIQAKAPWLGNVKLSHRLDGGEYKEVPLVRQRNSDRRRRKQQYRKRKQGKQHSPQVNLKDYINNPGEYDHLFDEINASRKLRKKNALSVSSCDSVCSCRSSSCSTCSSSSESDVSLPKQRVRKPRRKAREQPSSSPSHQQPVEATFHIGNKEYRLGVPMPDPKSYIDDFFNPPPEKVLKKKKQRRDVSKESGREHSRSRRSKSRSVSDTSSSSSSEGSSQTARRTSREGSGTTRREQQLDRSDSSSASSSDRSFISKLFRPKSKRGGTKSRESSARTNIGEEDISSPSRSSSFQEGHPGPGNSASEQDTANDSPTIFDRSKIPPAKLYRRKSFKHDIDRRKKTERRARSVHYQSSDRPVARDIQAFRDAAEAEAQARAEAQAAEAARMAVPPYLATGSTEQMKRRPVPAKTKKKETRKSAFKEHLSSEDVSDYTGMLQAAVEARQKQKEEETMKSGRRSSMERKQEDEMTNASSGAAS